MLVVACYGIVNCEQMCYEVYTPAGTTGDLPSCVCDPVRPIRQFLFYAWSMVWCVKCVSC